MILDRKQRFIGKGFLPPPPQWGLVGCDLTRTAANALHIIIWKHLQIAIVR